ncbi:MAG TPA: hypothetical protein VN577_15065 [Terriglobales bacterium]|nr:hypothetical protein [Terriglobales bacterium]
MLSLSKLRLVVGFFLMGWLAVAAAASDVRIAGPEGGDVRRLAAAPDNPNRIFLGTSSGRLYVSEDRGQSWAVFAHLGEGFDYILDNIEIDPTDSKIMYVAAWSIEGHTGELFRSRDGGKSWASLPGIKGKSIRALGMAHSNSKVLVAGTLDGVYRSDDRGDSWKLISPAGHKDIRNIESIAIDPKDPNTVYAGTWHLAWKTQDGGKNWKLINRGMIDDSDVFSIIVDPNEPNVVFASACSGIYKSQTAGEIFQKVPGIPFSSRRTRVLKQDPNNPKIVYAGTTEGLWRTTDLGQTWKRVTSDKVIINDVLLNASDPNMVLLATDRTGVLMSKDGAKTFAASNRGYSHRQVATVLVDQKSPNRLYAGTLNDREAGGVFVSEDGGNRWQQISSGLGGNDVFQVRQDDQGNLYAATNGGLFKYSAKSKLWMKVVPARVAEKIRVADMDLNGNVWYIATSNGLFSSKNRGATWTPVAGIAKDRFIAVKSQGGITAAATNNKVYASTNGTSWQQVRIPLVSFISGMTLDANGFVWLNSPNGVYRQVSDGWEKARELPQEKVASLDFDRRSSSMIAITREANRVLVSNDGRNWRSVFNAGVPVRSIALTNDRVFAGTTFDGVMTVNYERNRHVAGSEPGGGND